MVQDKARFAEFPVVGLSSRTKADWTFRSTEEEISFSGKVQNYCVCFIDMMGSTKVTADLSPAQLSRYYEIFLNGIALIARNFGAKIVKNAGDALIFYFEDTDDRKNIMKFKNVLNCGLTLSMASSALNAKMFNEKLPLVRYRISVDYGEVSIAKSLSSMSEDLFGSAMNICSKMNSRAKPNGLVIGENLFSIVKGLNMYVFEPAEGLTIPTGKYGVYHVEAKERRNTINPNKPS